MPVGIKFAAKSEFVDRAFLTDGGDDILEHPPIG